MSIGDRERSYIRRFIAAVEVRDSAVDLFREAEVAARRRSHLALVICRQAARLKIEAPENLELKTQTELEAIRVTFSKRIAECKRRPEELAA